METHFESKEESAEIEGECCICLESSDNKGFLACGHAFCFHCIKSWSESHLPPKCPMCRKPIEGIVFDKHSNLDYHVYFPLNGKTVDNLFFLTPDITRRRRMYHRRELSVCPARVKLKQLKAGVNSEERYSVLRRFMSRDVQAILASEDCAVAVSMVVWAINQFGSRSQKAMAHIVHILGEATVPFLREAELFFASRYKMKSFDSRIASNTVPKPGMYNKEVYWGGDEENLPSMRDASGRSLLDQPIVLLSDDEDETSGEKRTRPKQRPNFRKRLRVQRDPAAGMRAFEVNRSTTATEPAGNRPGGSGERATAPVASGRISHQVEVIDLTDL